MVSCILGQGWNISEKGLEIITKNQTIKDPGSILKNALDTDLKEIGIPSLGEIQNKSNISQVVLQIQKLRNVAAPKANENSNVAPRMLKLLLTDGENYIHGIEIGTLPSINLNKTPPGSKLLIHSAKICSGYLLLDGKNCSLLGGQVPGLYEKWELTKTVQPHYRQNTSSDGPPAWVNFGHKIQIDLNDKSFKSLENKNQESKENTKFDLQRQDAIAEATSGAVKKVFGGGSKNMTPVIPRSKPNDYKERKNTKHKNVVKETEEKLQKPSERVSLFDFLEDKLPTNEVAQSENTNYNNYKARYSQENYRMNTYPNQRTKFTNARNNRKTDEDIVNGLSNNLEKMSLNTQFASRSLKQHLNLDSNKNKNFDTAYASGTWKINDECMAKYWEDGKFYNAIVTAVTERTCVVKFKGYGNIEEVLKNDCLPVTNKRQQHHSGSVEFRRNARPYRRQ